MNDCRGTHALETGGAREARLSLASMNHASCSDAWQGYPDAPSLDGNDRGRGAGPEPCRYNCIVIGLLACDPAGAPSD